MSESSKDPLHGITLKTIIIDLVNFYGFEYLYQNTNIRCFGFEPSINSSLKFLRKNLWARKKLEDIYIEFKDEIDNKIAKNPM